MSTSIWSDKRHWRYRGPWVQNLMCGLCIGFTAGVYTALNSLGAGGGRPDSATVVMVANATLCATWFFSASFGGSILRVLGPGLTMSIGVVFYEVYVAALWVFDRTGNSTFVYVAGVIIGIGSGMVFITAGYIQLSYPEEKEKGTYISWQLNLQAFGAVVGTLIALCIDRKANSVSGVPTAVYVTLLVIMTCTAVNGFFLLPPDALTRVDGSKVGEYPKRSAWDELKSNLLIFTDWKILVCFPAFLPGEFFLIYGGSINAWHNNLRTRCLLSFSGVLLQIPFGILLQWLLDNPRWSRKKRALIGLTYVAIPLWAAWIWEIVRDQPYHRGSPPTAMDWTDKGFAGIFFLFQFNWISGSLWLYVVTFYLGALTNEPVKASHYAGVFRGVLGAGEAIVYGIDSMAVPFKKEATAIFVVYACGTLSLLYLGMFHLKETNYFDEDGVIVPNHILEENHKEPHAHVGETSEEKIEAGTGIVKTAE